MAEPDILDRDSEAFLTRRLEQGWILVEIGSSNARKDQTNIETWCEERMGLESNGEIWDTEVPNGDWERWTSGEYLIRERRFAIMFKLTWG